MKKEYPAKLINVKGYWFVECEFGTIDLGDCMSDLDFIEKFGGKK